MTPAQARQAAYDKGHMVGLVGLAVLPAIIFLLLPSRMPGYFAIGGALLFGQFLAFLWLPDKCGRAWQARYDRNSQKN